jgi:hypothetical protein
MPRTRPSYPPQIRQKILDLARSGRTVPSLAHGRSRRRTRSKAESLKLTEKRATAATV